MCKAFAYDMAKENYGTIVNVQSPAGHIGFGFVFSFSFSLNFLSYVDICRGATAYMAGRWALRGLVEALRADLNPTKVLVQEVILGETNSEYFKNNPASNERVDYPFSCFFVLVIIVHIFVLS